MLLTNALCVDSWAIVGEWDGRPRGETFSSRQTLNCGNRHERAGWDGKAGSLLTARNWAQTLFGANLNLGIGWRHPHTRDPEWKRNMQYLMLFWFPCLTRPFHVQHRFSAFWLRSKCSICSYQLNIWYGGHVPPSILNWFLQGDEVQELAPASSRVGLALQYRQDRPTSPLNTRRSSSCIMFANGRHCLSTKNNTFLHKSSHFRLNSLNNFLNLNLSSILDQPFKNARF